MGAERQSPTMAIVIPMPLPDCTREVDGLEEKETRGRSCGNMRSLSQQKWKDLLERDKEITGNRDPQLQFISYINGLSCLYEVKS